MPWPETLEDFRRERVIEPELCYVTSVAVGFAVSIYWKMTPRRYQVMRWDDGPGPGKEFWDWYLWERPQFFRTPARAAAAFVAGHAEWTAAQPAEAIPLSAI